LSKLDDIFGAKKPKDEGWRRIEINAQCGDCLHEADEVFVSPDKKHLKTIHYIGDEMHVVTSDVDLTWLTQDLS
jgi:hypothetical protein